MRTFLTQLLIKVLVINSDKEFSFEVHEPGSLSSHLLLQINNFRERNYSRKCPYLLAPEQSEIEARLALDERSYQFIARRKSTGEIVGNLRLTPYPFELTELSDHMIWDQPAYLKHLEIGRLLTDPSVRDVGKKILILAGIHASETSNYKGFIGVSRVESISYFKRFGMSPLSGQVNLKGRPKKYFIIHSDFKTMRLNVMKNYVSRLMTLPFFTKEKV